MIGPANLAQRGNRRISVDVPVNTPNSARPQIHSAKSRRALAAAGVPPRAIVSRQYTPADQRTLATIRLSYSRIAAVAGPCGLWPEDLGPSIHNRTYIENKSYYNFGCANQRNLAAMVDNPSDLVQPRPETPAYTARRTASFEKYRKGNTTATTYPESDKAKLSDTGK